MARSSREQWPFGALLFRRAMGCFAGAYAVVTVLASSLTIAYAGIEHTAAADARASSPVRSPSFSATVPYHVLIMLVVWTLFAWIYFRTDTGHPRTQLRQTLLLSVLWLGAAMIVDLVGFVLIRNPWSLTPRQFYLDYQPWISLIYLSILLSPWIRLGLAQQRSGRQPVTPAGRP